jgi:tetratricopeptide (TPR) repeat protein
MANSTGTLENTTPSPRQLFDRGNILFDSDNYTEAIATYEQAVAINPQLHEAWYNRGVALASLGRYEDAIESSTRLWRLNSKTRMLGTVVAMPCSTSDRSPPP